MLKVRKSNISAKLTKNEFSKRYQELFYDPYFDHLIDQIKEITEVAWKAYDEGRKAPKTQKAGDKYQNPHYELSLEWTDTTIKIEKAQRLHEDPKSPINILLITASHRNDQSCAGEISKSNRLLNIAIEELTAGGIEVQTLELDRLTSEFGKKIYPCKACVSTSMSLCHWPCSCYPNHSLMQIHDWMNDIYPMWARADGVLIITPVYWHQAPGALKLMMDRLVCADGGNVDPTSTKGKDAKLAKELELAGWDYPQHLKGRTFSVIVHGDSMGVDDGKSTLCDWLEEMGLIPTGNLGNIARYIGYFEPYATSHVALDKDEAIQQETRNAAKSLLISTKAQKKQLLKSFNPSISPARTK